jgi:predicted ribosome quality control (RQC) complex YloA/Tae2 family protein
MPLDGITAKALSIELNQTLCDSRVDRIFQPDRFDLIFHFRSAGTQNRLILSANPASPRIHLTSENRSNPAVPPMFCMLLRKHLTGARLLSVSTPDYERIFIFEFQTVNELGDISTKKLITEIMGRHSNIILVNDSNKIHDSILHVDKDMSRLREIMPARPYVLPPAQNKLTPQNILSLINENRDWLIHNSEVKTLEKSILATCQGFSPQLCSELCTLADIEPRARVENLTEIEKVKINIAMRETAQKIVDQQFRPSVFLMSSNDKVPIGFHCLRLISFAHSKQTGSVSEAMELFYLEKNRQNSFNQKKNYLTRLIQNQLEHAQKKLQIHLDDCREGQKSDQFKLFGELILSSIRQVDQAIQSGSDLVSVVNYYDPEVNEITIPVQYNRSAAWNAQNYFKRYSKGKAKFENGLKLSMQDKQDIEWLESLRSAVENAVDIDDLQAVRSELAACGLTVSDKTPAEVGKASVQDDRHAKINRLNPGKPGRSGKLNYSNRKNRKDSRKSSGNNKTGLPPRKYISKDGLEIIAGRNNLQNDQLTLKTANKNDIWLHVQKMPGTHVIIRGQQPIPDSTLLQAAGIAAWFSRAGLAGGAKAAVDYCPVSHVKKPVGARPGMVVYEKYQTVIVEPLNPDTLEIK